MSTPSGTASTTFNRAGAHALSYFSPSSQSSPFSDSSDVDDDGFLQSQPRAGGPYLCSLPAYSVAFSAGFYQRTGYSRDGQISETAEGILNEEHLPYKDIQFIGRRSKVDPEPEPIPTVLIVTEQCSRSVAKRIHRALESFHGICVEMITEAALAPTRCFPVPRSTSIYPKWDQICEAILSQCDISEWTLLECWRYGTSESAAENPVTVVVSVLKTSQDRFYTSTQRIRGILASFNERDVRILFLKNEINQFVEDPFLTKDACTLRVQPGVSIGIHSSSAGSSTLGGLVQLRFGTGPWQTYGLTNFHCVYPPVQHRETLNRIQGAREEFPQWVYSPVRPGNPMAGRLLQVDHPSVSDLTGTLSNLETALTQYENNTKYQDVKRRIKGREEGSSTGFVSEREEAFYNNGESAIRTMESERNDIKNFLDSATYFLGSVFAGSGVYRAGKRGQRQYHLDWALIQIRQERLGLNQPFLYGANLVPPVQAFEQGSFREAMNEEKVVCKSGRSTFVTRAMFASLRSVEIKREPDPFSPYYTRLVTRWEYGFASATRDAFLEPGDSGSFVFTVDGGVIGLLWGGSNRHDVGYVTPIEDIFNDIKAVTGASDVRIAL